MMFQLQNKILEFVQINNIPIEKPKKKNKKEQIEFRKSRFSKIAYIKKILPIYVLK